MLRFAPVAAMVALSACAQAPAHVRITVAQPCRARAATLVAANVPAISHHRYLTASRAAERAAAISLSCGDRWRAANALVVAAELAHQSHQPARAQRLLQRGYAIMHALLPPRHATALTSTLMAQRLDTAKRDMQGQWAYW